MALTIYGYIFRNSRLSRLKNLWEKKKFGTNLKWETNLEAGLQKILTKQKPGMIIIHKTWCGACRNLKPKFEASLEISNLSGGFVMISLGDENQPQDVKYMPDGDYVPRVIFLDPQGAVLVEVINEEGSSDYKYFYSDAETIAKSMKTVLKKYMDTWAYSPKTEKKLDKM